MACAIRLNDTRDKYGTCDRYGALDICDKHNDSHGKYATSDTNVMCDTHDARHAYKVQETLAT